MKCEGLVVFYYVGCLQGVPCPTVHYIACMVFKTLTVMFSPGRLEFHHHDLQSACKPPLVLGITSYSYFCSQ